MKKKTIAMVMAFILVVMNASMAHALAPVAEIYYNAGTSVYNSNDFESKLNDAIKVKLQEGGVNPKYVSIMDASANPAEVTDTTHVHSGYDSWYINNGVFVTTPEIETGDYNHVQILNNGKTLAFYGYTAPAYKDFMLTNGSPTGKKIITFDMDESKVNYHSMEGGGFLFNTKIDSEEKLSGYAILYVSGSIKVYQINEVNAIALHNEKLKALSMVTGVTEIGSYPKGASTHHTIKINVTDTKLNMWDNGAQIIKDLSLPKVYGDEFGPIVSHNSHGCGVISIFVYDNMKLFSTSSKTLDEAAEQINWETNTPLRYVVDINDDPSVILDGGPKQSDLKDSLNNKGAQYIGVSDPGHKEKGESFIEDLAKGGFLVDSTKNSEEIIEKIAERIAEKIISDYKEAILFIEKAENKTDIKFKTGDNKNTVTSHITLQEDEDVTTVWSSDQPSIISPDGTVTRPVMDQSGTYVTLTATITKDGLTSEKSFTVFVKAAAPGPLTTLSATAGNGQVTLNFPPLNDAEEDDIVVEQSLDGVDFTPVDLAETLDADSTSATITDLTNGETYYFRVVVKSGFYTGTSNVVKVSPSESLTTLKAVAGNKQVTLKFPVLTGATNIVVEQSEDGETFTPATTTGTLDDTSTSATVTGLTNGVTYHIRLSVESGQFAGVSNVVTVKPSSPPAPTVEEPPAMNTKVTVSDQSNGGQIVQDKITKLVGDNLKVTGKVKSANGQELNLPNVTMNPDGSFTIPHLPAGEYKLSLNVIAPNGEKLAGPVGKLTVGANGSANLSVDLVDPYGTILDVITNQPVAGVNMQLYWADTELNRSKGRVPGTLVNLPELSDFAPNQNHNPQISSADGEYGWMVYADGDYYFLGERDGYIVFDSRNDKRDERFGDDSYIKDGIIHVGETIVKFSFSSQPKLKEAGDHSPFMVGYPDGTFQPDRGIVRSEVAAILSRLYTDAAKANKVSYSDVSEKHWAADAITIATNNKWMVGTGDNKFQPKKQITRAEFAQLLTNLYKWDVVQKSSYNDVTGHWAEKAIATVEKQGMLFDFKEKTFNPNQPITRVEVVRIFNQLMDRKPWDVQVGQKWTDVSENHEFYRDIMEASIPHPFEQFETGIESWKK
ncbi:S-layer homology domain-containing protein [Paenibacillus paeoniae]|uniref:S-layer homology domain-containing protein n=1 Tax=Paenibacillus paeoniae TaxID=2292705 RepID=A0A371PE76_9BACL|nr:S-layer homology domain-containing protein [Paenibacillus paeoniae]REK74214.1 S-layer homology domain-containing protein [Paenibacillus paeoniae]